MGAWVSYCECRSFMLIPAVFSLCFTCGYDPGGDSPWMTVVDLPGRGWWEDGWVVVAGLYSLSLLSHSRLTWACGANWLLIASLYTDFLHMQKPGPSGETSLMRLSISTWACLDTPIHNPHHWQPCSHLKMPPGKTYLQKDYMLSSHHYGFTQSFPPTFPFLWWSTGQSWDIWRSVKEIRW